MFNLLQVFFIFFYSLLVNGNELTNVNELDFIVKCSLFSVSKYFT